MVFGWLVHWQQDLVKHVGQLTLLTPRFLKPCKTPSCLSALGLRISGSVPPAIVKDVSCTCTYFGFSVLRKPVGAFDQTLWHSLPLSWAFVSVFWWRVDCLRVRGCVAQQRICCDGQKHISNWHLPWCDDVYPARGTLLLFPQKGTYFLVWVLVLWQVPWRRPKRRARGLRRGTAPGVHATHTMAMQHHVCSVSGQIPSCAQGYTM